MFSATLYIRFTVGFSFIFWQKEGCHISAVINIVNLDVHSAISVMATAECLPSAADIQSTFEHYFSIGFGIADSLRLYRTSSNFDSNHPGNDAFVFPNYRMVRHWHSLWYNKHGDMQGLTVQPENSSRKKKKESAEKAGHITQISSVEELGQGEMNIEPQKCIPGMLAYKHCSVKMSEFLFPSILPKSFTNRIIHVDDKNFVAHIRSDVNCAQDCFSWVKEFGEQSLTKWILCSCTQNGLRKIVCRRIFICHLSNCGKEEHKRSNKNFSCNATIKIVVENATNDSKFVQEGLPALIVIQNAHSHPTTVIAASSFLPSRNDVQLKFEEYFNKGLGIASSLRYHKENLKTASNCLDIPTYGTVKQWYKKWRTAQPLSNIDDTSITDDEFLGCGHFKNPNLKISEYFDAHFLPKSFKNHILKVDDVQVLLYIRSDVNCVQDCIYWIKEFGKQSSTKWILYSSSPNPPPEVICQSSFICHHSSYWKKKNVALKSKPNKNFNCKAKITLTVQGPMAENNFVKDGLPALIILRNCHNHPIMTATDLSFLSAKDGTQAKFESYFFKGFGVSESIRCYKADLNDRIDCFMVPKYDTVKTWHTKWQKKYLGSDFCKDTSKTSVSESISSLPETIVKSPKVTNTNVSTVVKMSADKIEDCEFHQLLEEFKKCHQIFGTDRITHLTLMKQLKAVTTKDAWNTLLCTASLQESNKIMENISCK